LTLCQVQPSLLPIADTCLKFVASTRPSFEKIEEVLGAVERDTGFQRKRMWPEGFRGAEAV
jgi:hypothetical protein